MSSMLWAAAAAVATPVQVTAEELLERARSFYSLEQDAAQQVCPESSEEEIVVCREIGDPERYRVPSPTDEGKTDDGIPRAPNVSASASTASTIASGSSVRRAQTCASSRPSPTRR